MLVSVWVSRWDPHFTGGELLDAAIRVGKVAHGARICMVGLHATGCGGWLIRQLLLNVGTTRTYMRPSRLGTMRRDLRVDISSVP